jgi:hypothetical protein
VQGGGGLAAQKIVAVRNSGWRGDVLVHQESAGTADRGGVVCFWPCGDGPRAKIDVGLYC